MKKKRRAPRPPSETGIHAGPPPLGLESANTAVRKGAPPATGSQGALGWYAATIGVVALAVFGMTAWSYELWPFAPKAQATYDDAPLKLNAMTPPGRAPAGMVWVPGGEFWMGVNEDDFEVAPGFFADAEPVHRVYVDGFWMDKTEVTNADFERFVKATGYVTVAERKPDPKDFPPGTPPEKLRDPFSIVFHQPGPGEDYDLRQHLGWWEMMKGASWRHPEGPASSSAGREEHPAVHICWHDAVAYCKWAGKRLPTEAEWEFAARGGRDRKKYCWGDELKPGGKWRANAWQGNFPRTNTLEDGHFGTAPVGSYPANGYGLFDMAGNVWEWCADFFQPDYYAESPAKNPQGPLGGFDLHEPGVPKRVQRGGSFLCADNYCMRYLPGARGKGEPSSSGPHIGFRCVRD